MDQSNASRTAKLAAGLRAAHTEHDGGTVFSDPYAKHFAGRTAGLLARLPKVANSMAKLALWPGLAAQASVVVRSRFAEDCLRAAIAAGCKQYVLLGAGLDSFAIRHARDFPELQIFELDHPNTQRYKQAELAKLNFVTPPNLHYIPINFEQQSIEDVLSDSAFKTSEKSFWCWLGVTYYLTREALVASLQSMAKVGAPGTELVLDYALPPSELPIFESAAVRGLGAFTATLSEPLIGFLNAEELEALMADAGWEVAECLTGEQQYRRYKNDWPLGVRPPAAVNLLRARR